MPGNMVEILGQKYILFGFKDEDVALLNAQIEKLNKEYFTNWINWRDRVQERIIENSLKDQNKSPIKEGKQTESSIIAICNLYKMEDNIASIIVQMKAEKLFAENIEGPLSSMFEDCNLYGMMSTMKGMFHSLRKNNK